LIQTPCLAGYKSSADKSFCEACPAGSTSTDPPSDKCVMCSGNNVSYAPGTPVSPAVSHGAGPSPHPLFCLGLQCTPCGAGTTATADHADCDLNGCIFAGDSMRLYDLSG